MLRSICRNILPPSHWTGLYDSSGTVHHFYPGATTPPYHFFDEAYTYGPEETGEGTLVRVCEARWQIEECFAQTKGEVGMDQYEVRTWTAWHRFVTLCLVAHASLVVMRHAARQEEAQKRGVPTPA